MSKSPFRPILSKKSVKLTENRSGSIFERLYSLRKNGENESVKIELNRVDYAPEFDSILKKLYIF